MLPNDHGTGTGRDSHFFYEAGLKAGIWNFFELYIPQVVSGNIESITSTFKNRIRFVFTLDALSQVKMNSGIGFEIR